MYTVRTNDSKKGSKLGRSVKKRLNVDSPSFTPANLTVNGSQAKPKSIGISPKFANAAPFKPKGLASRPGRAHGDF